MFARRARAARPARGQGNDVNGKRLLVFGALLAVGGALVAACGGDDEAPAGTGTTAIDASPSASKVTLRLGYFPNITHAQAVIGVASGTFQAELGSNVRLETKIFNAGPAEIDALFAGEIDAGFIGPSPAINGYVKSNGEALRVVAGGASGGALFIVRPEANINGPNDLAGKVLASPQLGGTQDVALRAYIAAAGLKTRENGGKVTVQPLANADTLTRFKQGKLDGAWVPEPWATRLVQEANGKVLVDEKALWPRGQFATTNLIVSTKFLATHPDVVEALIRGEIKTIQFIQDKPEEAKKIVNDEIARITTAGLAPAVIDAAWKNLDFTWDPIAASLRKSADDAFALGFLGSKKPDLSKIYDLTILNRVLAQLNLEAVKQ